MVSDRIQRRVERFLDAADEAAARFDWAAVRANAEAVLRLDPQNPEALTYLAAAEREPASGSEGEASPTSSIPEFLTSPGPTSFVDGRYQVIRFLGEGGKKRVYLAHDTRLDRDVAFALIKTEGLDQEGLDRITREAQAMGKLGDHPHIVPVFDIGDEGGQRYIVSQFMPGGDVEGLLAQAPDHKLPLEEALRITQQVCRALEHAHAHGIVHRDLKPGNVWLTADGTAKIGDFGLAVALDRSRLTQAGMMVGTVAYMPPEQAMGGDVTFRSDLYSLGAMLYELVCGRPPFVGEESVAVITQHLNTPPVAPTWHRSDCPPGLEALIMRLLEKDPDKRPASAAGVRRSLESLVSGLESPPPDASGGPEPETKDQRPETNPLYRRTFVGREAELRQLQAAFDGAVSGQGGLVMVVGEPGIGKTALCEQLATYTTIRGGKALVGHCYEEGSLTLPYLPFVEALRSYVLAREPDALKQELGSGATDVARIVSEIREKVPVEPREAGDPEDDRWRLYQAVTGFLRNASLVQPLVIVLEDLHWADRGTLDYLVHLSRNLAGVRLLIVGTYRDVEVDRSHPLSATLAELRRGSNYARIPLRGLTPDEVHRMLNSLTGQDVRWSLAEAVHRQTEGNPLFIQEVLRYMVEEGLISRQGGRWRRAGEDAPEMRIPEGLRDVIGKRLSRLSPECNRLLSVAAVMGRDFRVDVLRVVASLPEDELTALLEEAASAAVIESRGGPGMGLAFRFAHAFFRQTLYEEIFAMRRVRLHQQVGRALESVYGRRAEEHAAELAEHFSQSTEREDAEKALAYSETAARRATAVYAYGEAVRHLERALQVQELLDPEDSRKRCLLLLSLAEVLGPAGEPQRAVEEVTEEAFHLTEALADAALASRACDVAFDGLTRLGGASARRSPAGRRWAERGDRHAPPDTTARVRADLSLGDAVAGEGRFADRSDYYRKALEGARRLGDPRLLFLCGVRLLGNLDLGYWEPTLALARELAVLPREGVSLLTLSQVQDNCAAILLADGDRTRAESLWRESDEMASHTPDPYLTLRSNTHEIRMATLDGRLEGALDAAARLTILSEESGSPHYGLLHDTILGMRARLYLGRFQEALDGLLRMQGARGRGNPDRRALCLAYLGQDAEAREFLDGCATRWRTQPPGPETGLSEALCLVESAVLLRHRDALALFTPFLAPLAHLISTKDLDLTCVARHLGAAAVVLGDAEGAHEYYRQAMEVCQRVRFRPEIALTRLQLAELLLEHYPDEKPSAIEHLDFAIAEFREMKMQPSLERALKHKGLLGA